MQTRLAANSGGRGQAKEGEQKSLVKTDKTEKTTVDGMVAEEHTVCNDAHDLNLAVDVEDRIVAICTDIRLMAAEVMSEARQHNNQSEDNS